MDEHQRVIVRENGPGGIWIAVLDRPVPDLVTPKQLLVTHTFISPRFEADQS